MKDKQADDAGREQDRLLDEALAETFPASDPISMQQIVIVGRVQRSFFDGISRAKADKRS
jgi:hypothetical protein